MQHFPLSWRDLLRSFFCSGSFQMKIEPVQSNRQSEAKASPAKADPKSEKVSVLLCSEKVSVKKKNRNQLHESLGNVNVQKLFPHVRCLVSASNISTL